VTGLDYRAYVPMAEKEMTAILHEAEARWAGEHRLRMHRIGETFAARRCISGDCRGDPIRNFRGGRAFWTRAAT